MRAIAGQASVELVVGAALLIVVAVAGATALSRGAERAAVDASAHAGALAVSAGLPPRRAALAALPAWARSSARIDVRGGRVTVALAGADGAPRVRSVARTRDAGR